MLANEHSEPAAVPAPRPPYPEDVTGPKNARAAGRETYESFSLPSAWPKITRYWERCGEPHHGVRIPSPSGSLFRRKTPTTRSAFLLLYALMMCGIETSVSADFARASGDEMTYWGYRW
jgi:hypothetical protein